MSCFWPLNRGRKRRSPSSPSEPAVQFSRDGLSSQLFPHRQWMFSVATGELPFEPHPGSISGDPHARLGQSGSHHLGRHRRVHHQTGTHARFVQAGLADDDPAQRDAETAHTLQVQSPCQDVVWICLIQHSQLVQNEADVLREERNDAAGCERPTLAEMAPLRWTCSSGVSMPATAPGARRRPRAHRGIRRSRRRLADRPPRRCIHARSVPPPGTYSSAERRWPLPGGSEPDSSLGRRPRARPQPHWS